MARRRKISADDDIEDDAELPVRARRRPRRRWRLMLAFVVIVGLVIGAPTIIAKTPLRNLLLTSALPSGTGRLTASQANFSWAGGQSLAGVAHADAAGAPLFTAESVVVSRSLIGLASNPDNLGKLMLTRPVMHLDTRDGGSNLEDFLQRVVDAARQRPSPTPGAPQAKKTIEVEIIDGVVLGRDFATGQQWRIDALAATAKPHAETESWEVTASGILTLSATAPTSASQRLAGEARSDVAATPNQPGRFKFHLHPAAAGAEDGPARLQIDLVADRLPLAPIEPWLARVLPQARLTGETSADLHVAWTPTSEVAAAAPGEAPQLGLTANGKLDATNLRFTAAALFGDLIELPTASIALDAALAGRRLTARQCSARSDWLQAELNGDFDLNELAALSLKSLPTSDATVTARADLPQLARMLPRTLRLRPDLRVDAGSMEITARSAKADAGRRWTVAAAVQDLMGSDGTRPIRWTKPVEIGVDAIDSPAGPQLQRAILRSAFATATADGTAGGLEGELQFNLDELAAQLGQFVDLSAWRLHGAGDGQFSWRDTGPERFAASAKLNLRDIDVQREGKVVWQDPQLEVAFDSSGDRSGMKPQRVEAASFTMKGPADTLAVELLEPANLADFNHAWNLELTGNGPLELWAGRLRPWIAGIPELAGQSTLTAQVRLREGLVHVSESKLSVKDLRAQIGATTIIENGLEAAGDFRWDAREREIESHDMQFTSSALAARAQGLSVRFAETGPPTVRGNVAFRGDFERLAAWGGLFGAAPEGLRPRGRAVGRLQLASDATRATGNLNLTAEPLQLVNAADGSLVWDEPRLEFGAEAVYANAEDRLQLSNIRLTGKTVQMSGAGLVEQLRTAGVVQGDMNVAYDAAELAKLLAAYLGPGIQIQGANTARLQIAGSLNPPPSQGGARGGITDAATLNAATSTETIWNSPVAQPPGGARGYSGHWSRTWQLTTETGWAAANLYGLPLSAARLTANVRDGQIQVTPLDLSVGQGGRLSLHPRVLLDPPPQRLEIAPGQIISNVAISAEVSERMLKYAAPIVAGATRTEGAFSFFLEGADIPLRQPKQGRLQGRLTIHRLSVMPGPLIQDVVTLIRQIESVGKNAQGAGQGPLGLGLLGGAAQPAEPIKGLTMSERAIDVQVVDGRVYHRNLEFLIDDVPVRSQGSVGFDETLALMIEVPIQAKWVGNKPALKPLIGQVMQIPVSGTFSKPRVDSRAIGGFAAQAAGQAASGLLGEELNKALDKLLRPK
jgi:hypothetical protein